MNEMFNQNSAEAMKKFPSMEAVKLRGGDKQEKINIYNANGSHKKGSHLFSLYISIPNFFSSPNFASFIAEIKL